MGERNGDPVHVRIVYAVARESPPLSSSPGTHGESAALVGAKNGQPRRSLVPRSELIARLSLQLSVGPDARRSSLAAYCPLTL